MHVGRLSGPFLRFVDAFERVEGKGGTPLNGARSDMGEVETVCAKGCMCVWSILVCVVCGGVYGVWWCVWCVN